MVVNVRHNNRYDIYIGRQGQYGDGYFGNPIKRNHLCQECGLIHKEPGSTLECYERYLRHRISIDHVFAYRVKNLDGRTLACWCAPGPCHGHVLERVAKELVALDRATAEASMQVHRQYLNTAGLQQAASAQDFKPVPRWLGNFSFKMFGKAYRRNYGRTPEPLRTAAVELASLRPQQVFTTVFLQRYTVGQQVLAHRDPRNNVGVTVIGVFGDFTGAVSHVGNESLQLNSGDVLVLPCTINGVQGPRHSVSPVTSGTRYALILNTII